MPEELQHGPGRVRGFLTAPASRFVAKRFALKLAMILVFATVQSWTPWGFADALAALAAGSATINIAFALLLRQRFRGNVLTYWDEAMAFAAIALVALIWWHMPVGLGRPARQTQTAVQQYFR